MSSPAEIDQQKLVELIAKALKEKRLIEPPVWAKFVKTGPAKERPPENKDWWYVRAASILRRMYFDRKPMGTNRLARIYGDKTKNTRRKHVFKPVGRNHIRKILQQLEKAGLIKHVTIGTHKGRVITGKGIKLVKEVCRQ
jgi:small subunit ribosomal protein S19e